MVEEVWVSEALALRPSLLGDWGPGFVALEGAQFGKDSSKINTAVVSVHQLNNHQPGNAERRRS